MQHWNTFWSVSDLPSNSINVSLWSPVISKAVTSDYKIILITVQMSLKEANLFKLSDSSIISMCEKLAHLNFHS